MNDPPAHDPREFTSTHWSLVLAAGPDGASRTRARSALESLCRTYWYPLYAFVRCRGYSADDAQDLTQSFFVRLIEKGGITAADPERGRFRSYLLGAMKHFLANEWQRARTQKRGGGVTIVDLDALEAEARYARVPGQTDPDASFDREWARESIARAMEQLRQEWRARGRVELFEALAGSLTGDGGYESDVAARFGMSAGAVKVAVHRLRQRYREILRAGIAETVADPADVDDEMCHLVVVLRRK